MCVRGSEVISAPGRGEMLWFFFFRFCFCVCRKAKLSFFLRRGNEPLPPHVPPSFLRGGGVWLCFYPLLF